MTPLPITFRSDGFSFHQLAREGNLALFRKTKSYPTGYKFDTYEVVKVQRNPTQEIDGILKQAWESMPSTNSWGTHGWSLQTLEDAWDKFNSLKGL